jgi:hypothetical protein
VIQRETKYILSICDDEYELRERIIQQYDFNLNKVIIIIMIKTLRKDEIKMMLIRYYDFLEKGLKYDYEK